MKFSGPKHFHRLWKRPKSANWGPLTGCFGSLGAPDYEFRTLAGVHTHIDPWVKSMGLSSTPGFSDWRGLNFTHHWRSGKPKPGEAKGTQEVISRRYPRAPCELEADAGRNTGLRLPGVGMAAMAVKPAGAGGGRRSEPWTRARLPARGQLGTWYFSIVRLEGRLRPPSPSAGRWGHR